MALVLEMVRNKNSKKEAVMEMSYALVLKEKENLAIWGRFHRQQSDECES